MYIHRNSLYDIYVFPWKDDNTEKSCIVIANHGDWSLKDMKYDQADISDCFIRTITHRRNILFTILLKLIGNAPDALSSEQVLKNMTDLFYKKYMASKYYEERFKGELDVSGFKCFLNAYGCENIIDDETAVAYIIPLQKEVILEGLLNYQEPF